MTILQLLINGRRRRMNRLFLFLSYPVVLSKAAVVLLTCCVRICLLTLHGVNKKSESAFGKR